MEFPSRSPSLASPLGQSSETLPPDYVSTVEELLASIDAHREAFMSQQAYAPAPVTVAAALVEHVKHLVSPLSIRLVAEPVTAEDPRTQKAIRLLLSCARDSKYFSMPLVRRANGLILRVPLARETTGATSGLIPSLTSLLTKSQIPGGSPVASPRADAPAEPAPRPLCASSVLVQPPNNFTAYSRARNHDEPLAQLIERGLYHQYAMREGTTVTLYFHGGAWVAGTRRSYEADALIWRGHKFRCVLDHALKVACPNFSLELLKPQHSYTLGYHHPAHHPFGQSGIWYKEYFDAVTSDPKKCKGWLIEVWFIRSSESAPAEDVAKQIGIPLQRELPAPLSLSTMLQRNHRAMEDYRTAVAARDHDYVPHMGFILRSRDEDTTRELSDVLLPSTLYGNIRDLIYENPYRNRDVSLAMNHREISFVLLSGYLNKEKSRVLRELFPQFGVYYKLYDTVFKKAAEYVIQMARGVELSEPDVLDVRNSASFTAYLLALRIGDRVRARYDPNSSDRRGREKSTSTNIIIDLLRDPANIANVYEVIHLDAPRIMRERSERLQAAGVEKSGDLPWGHRV